jgi:hypothetical protein
MWHPATGYWNGIDPEGELAGKYGHLLTRTGDGRLVPKPEFEKMFLFYSAFHGFLKQCGADFVKVDCESFLRGHYKGKASVGKAARNYHDAQEASVGLHFDGLLMNCGGMASENLWNRPTSSVSRCSLDFVPENREWFIRHLIESSFNSYLLGAFQWCDWDMWWTDDSQSVKNGVLRAISGGPVYVSDKQGRSVKEALLPIVFSDGRIIRCDRPALPSGDCLVGDPEMERRAFKVWSTARGYGVLAAFNLNKQGRAVTGTAGASDIPCLAGERFVLYEHFSRSASFVSREESVSFVLEDHDDFRLYIIAPVSGGYAPLGLIGKFVSPGCIEASNGRNVLLREGGLFAFASETPVDGAVVNAERRRCGRDGILHTVDCSDISGRVFISVEKE